MNSYCLVQFIQGTAKKNMELVHLLCSSLKACVFPSVETAKLCGISALLSYKSLHSCRKAGVHNLCLAAQGVVEFVYFFPDVTTTEPFIFK